jgi:hypothetical protein
MSPRGDEIFFTRGTGWPQSQIMTMRKTGSTWLKPEVASFVKNDWAT